MNKVQDQTNGKEGNDGKSSNKDALEMGKPQSSMEWQCIDSEPICINVPEPIYVESTEPFSIDVEPHCVNSSEPIIDEVTIEDCEDDDNNESFFQSAPVSSWSHNFQILTYIYRKSNESMTPLHER